jgi:hypothetical protein
MRMKLISGLVVAVALGAAAHATEFVTNGGFETVSGASGSFEYDPLQPSTDHGVVTGWSTSPGTGYNILFNTATALTVQPLNRFSSSGQSQDLSAEPTNTGSFGIGNNFMALDGDSGVRGAFNQTINGLTAGQTYLLTFDWASVQLADRAGTTQEFLTVSLGGESHNTLTLTEATDVASLWNAVSMTFTATGPSEVLSFLSVGSPDGLPPMALLDNVSLTNTVPEPATWGLMLVGVAAVGASLRLRRRAAAAAA